MRVLIQRARGLRVDDQAAPFARLIRSPNNLGGAAGGGDSVGDGEEDEVGRTATGRGSHAVWHDRPSIVGPNSSTGNGHWTAIVILKGKYNKNKRICRWCEVGILTILQQPGHTGHLLKFSGTVPLKEARCPRR